MTIAVQIYLPKAKMERDCRLWAYLFTYYFTSFGILWLQDLNEVELWSENNLTKFLFYGTVKLWYYLSGDFIEDLIFRDMNVVGGLWHLWGWFWPSFLVTLIGYGLQYKAGNLVHSDVILVT